MGFFVRSKKVKKNSPSPKSRGRTTEQWPLPPPPPSHASRQPDGWDQQPAHFQSAGLLPPPPGWTAGSALYQPPRSYPPIIINQNHYYLGASPPSSQVAAGPSTINTSLGKLNLGSAVDLAQDLYEATGIRRVLDDALPLWHGYANQLVNEGNMVTDQITNHFDNVLTMIDQGRYNGKERDIFAWQPPLVPSVPVPVHNRGPPKSRTRDHKREHPKGQTTTAATIVSGGFFSKVDRYANSKLPMNLPPLKLYIPTYPLLCLAAQYSEGVYEKPRGAERDAHVSADLLTGTKAMVIKSVPMDYMNTIVFAIRGTSSIMDWTVNLNMSPTSPEGFLDDPGNLCHAGFLSVARKMVSPVARRLRQLLEEDPGRASHSLLITGHSAGGAVAALLYNHMLATSAAAQSELTAVAGCFKRIHCVTFGTPPVSLMPLAKPDDDHSRRRLRKSLFLSFVNEGDPVARADKAYVKSLLELFVAPVPPPPPPRRVGESTEDKHRGRKQQRRREDGKGKEAKQKDRSRSRSVSRRRRPVWKVPPCTLSCAGRIVVLRSGDPDGTQRQKKKRTKKAMMAKTVEARLQEGVVAQIVTDEQLRGVVWGDPVAHMMRLYAGRVEMLAVGAVTGRV
ncbi:hypothetical protein VTK26DRAFT_7225 [Humicola hyalothermophila]